MQYLIPGLDLVLLKHMLWDYTNKMAEAVEMFEADDITEEELNLQLSLIDDEYAIRIMYHVLS